MKEAFHALIAFSSSSLLACGGAAPNVAAPRASAGTTAATPAPAPAPPRRPPSEALLRYWRFGADPDIAFHVDVAGLFHAGVGSMAAHLAADISHAALPPGQEQCVQQAIAAIREVLVGGTNHEGIVLVSHDPSFHPAACLAALGAKPTVVSGASEAFAIDRDVLVLVPGVALFARREVVERALDGQSGRGSSPDSVSLGPDEYAAWSLSPDKGTHVAGGIEASNERFRVRIDADVPLPLADDIQAQWEGAKGQLASLDLKGADAERLTKLLSGVDVHHDGGHVEGVLDLHEPPAEQVGDLGVLASIGVASARHYLAEAKAAEARTTIGAIAKSLAAEHERDDVSRGSAKPGQKGVVARPRLVSLPPVPKDIPRGVKYQSSPADWKSWAPIAFEMDEPQYLPVRGRRFEGRHPGRCHRPGGSRWGRQGVRVSPARPHRAGREESERKVRGAPNHRGRDRREGPEGLTTRAGARTRRYPRRAGGRSAYTRPMLVPKSFRLLALLGAGCLPYACSSGSSSTSDAGPPTDATADAYGAEGGGSGEASADASVDASPDALAAEGGADVSPGDAGIETGAEAGAPQHLYVGNDNALGGIRRYTLPVTPSSMPEFVIADANITTLALDGSGDLAAGDNAGNLTFFTAPLSGASTPGATFNNRMFDGGDAGAGKNDGQIAFLPGDTTLFAANLGKSVNVFDSPFSNATMPASSITSAGLTGAFGLAFDAAKNLYVSNPGAPGSTLYVFPPPYTGTPLVTPLLTGRAYRKLVVSATQLFVCDVGGTNGGVDVYDLPLTTSSAPAFSMTQGMQAPEGIAMDSRGNLYVGNLSNATVNVYAPPFSASSAPASGIALAPDGGAYAVFGIAIGL